MTGKKVASFRERFTELIDSSPKSRTAIADEFGVAKQTISAWLTGQNSPRLPVVVSLAEYFGVTVEWLNGFDVPKYSVPPDKTPENDGIESDDIRLLIRGLSKLSPEQVAQAKNVFRAMFMQTNPDLFEEGSDNDDA